MGDTADLRHAVVERVRVLADQLARFVDAERAQVVGDRRADVGDVLQTPCVGGEFCLGHGIHSAAVAGLLATSLLPLTLPSPP